MISLSKSVISKTLKQKKVLHLTFELSNFQQHVAEMLL